ncbi:hypothetical protein DL768_007371 [Monosporascus sp. mg162]|nr:hypothetical protein DL768_007371 [Monosporascus sp. mg162]
MVKGYYNCKKVEIPEWEAIVAETDAKKAREELMSEEKDTSSDLPPGNNVQTYATHEGSKKNGKAPTVPYLQKDEKVWFTPTHDWGRDMEGPYIIVSHQSHGLYVIRDEATGQELPFLVSGSELLHKTPVQKVPPYPDIST